MYDFNVVGSVDEIEGDVDFVFASEYFEHIYDSLAHIKDIVDKINPRYLYLASSFNTVSIGHFTQYVGTPQDKMSRLFNDTLKELGYRKVKAKIWNNKPLFWEKSI